MQVRLKSDFVAYSISPIDKSNLPTKTKLSRICPDGEVVCPCCGVRALYVVVFRHKNESNWTRHINYFYVRSIQDDVQVLEMMTMDHFLPRSLGGTDRITNLRAMCYQCNQERKDEVTFAEWNIIRMHPERYFSTGARKKLRAEARLPENDPTHPIHQWFQIFKQFPDLQASVRFA